MPAARTGVTRVEIAMPRNIAPMRFCLFFMTLSRVVESVSSEDALNSREIRPLNYRSKIQISLMFLAVLSTLRKAFSMSRFASLEGVGRAAPIGPSDVRVAR